MAINFKDFQAIHNGISVPGRARKMQSDQIMLNTWWQDIQSQTAYIYDYYHDQKSTEAFKLNNLHPQDDPEKTPLPIKFIRHQKQTYDKDSVTFWLQMQPGQGCNLDYYEEVLGRRYNAIFPIGTYVDVQHEDGTYNKWLVVDKANYNGNQFPTFEILRCDYLAQWIYNGQKYQCPAVLRSQNSYNSGLWLDLNKVPHVSNNMRKNLLNCWKFLRVSILQHENETSLCVNVLKILNWTISSQALMMGKVQRLCDSSESCWRDLYQRL